VLCGCRHWTGFSAEALEADTHEDAPGIPSQEAPSRDLVCHLSCDSGSLKPGEALVVTVRVENPTDIPVDVDIRGLSWDEIAEIERRIADAQSKIDDPEVRNNDSWKEMRDRLVELLDTIREHGPQRVMGIFHITDLRTKKSHVVDKTSVFCGTGRQFAAMPPGTVISRKFEFQADRLLREGEEGDVGIVFRVFGRVDGKSETIAVSNQLRVCVLAADEQATKGRGSTQPADPPDREDAAGDP
jgi:hypothetical protein